MNYFIFSVVQYRVNRDYELAPYVHQHKTMISEDSPKQNGNDTSSHKMILENRVMTAERMEDARGFFISGME